MLTDIQTNAVTGLVGSVFAAVATFLSFRAKRARSVDQQLTTFNQTLLDQLAAAQIQLAAKDVENARLRALALDYRAHAQACVSRLQEHDIEAPVFTRFDQELALLAPP